MRRFADACLAIACTFVVCARGTFELALGDDSDLTNFVTRPDIKVPVLNVTKYLPSQTSSGFFFVAPYVRIFQEKFPSSYYQPCQTGPHIYDSDGNLVWTGSCTFANANIADFRAVLVNGSWRLSGIHTGLRERDIDEFGAGQRRGHAFVLNGSYLQESEVRMPKSIETFNIHEFRVLNKSYSALIILYRPEYVDVSMVEDVDREAGWVANMGFQEVDLTTGRPLFEWWALDHVQLTESSRDATDLDEDFPTSWNFFHLNSVDKSSHGDYLISSQNTDTVYCVSGKDGSILWRLGGKNSTFTHDDLSFSRQHDARFLEPDSMPFASQGSLQHISIFDNAVDGLGDDDVSTPSVLIVALDVKEQTARVVSRVKRPDEGTTVFGGNSNYLSNGNLFASWGVNAYATEHLPDGSVAMEARFTSERFRTYRMYKSDFQGRPSESPVMKCQVYGTSIGKPTTVCWVSWNGATEVAHWRFRALADGDDITTNETTFRTVQRTGFETRVQVQGHYRTMVAEALDLHGDVLGTSDMLSTVLV